MVKSGDLKTFNMVDILQVISAESKDCILSIESNGKVYGIYFYKGNPVYVRNVKRSFLLYLDMDFDIVLKREKVSRDDIFVNLATYLPVVLNLKEGKFSITSGFIKYPEDLNIYVESTKLIILLSRNLTQEEVNRKITDLSLIYEKVPDYEKKINNSYLSDMEKEILSMVNGKNKVSDIVVKIHFDKIFKSDKVLSLSHDKEYIEKLYKETELDVKKALYGFIAAGLIRKYKPDRKSDNIINRIISYLETKSLKDTLKEM